jgi:hypothetical protein
MLQAVQPPGLWLLARLDRHQVDSS